MSRLKKDSGDYEEYGDSQLTPSELLQIRNWCLAQDTSYHFQIYTMLIVMVKLFLRCDDVDFAFHAFDKKYFIVNNGILESIGIWVDGQTKRKTNPVLLLLHRDYDVAAFDALAHLQAHIAANEMDPSGAVFPGKKWHTTPQPKFQVPISYEEFSSEFKGICTKVLRRSGPFGLHTLQATGYLLASWYRASLDESMLAARHSTVENAMKYYQSASTTIYLIQRTAPDDIVSRVQPIWKPIRIDNVCKFMQEATRHSMRPGCQPRTLATHASEFLLALANRNGWVDDEDSLSAVRSSFTFAELGKALLQPAVSTEDPEKPPTGEGSRGDAR